MKPNVIRVSNDVYDRLAKLAHTDQSLNGVIAEILDKYYPLPKAPEPPKPPEKGYEAPPNTAVKTIKSEVNNDTNNV